jgi:hypothetical protein
VVVVVVLVVSAAGAILVVSGAATVAGAGAAVAVAIVEVESFVLVVEDVEPPQEATKRPKESAITLSFTNFIKLFLLFVIQVNTWIKKR